jgi:hypothetical protein
MLLAVAQVHLERRERHFVQFAQRLIGGRDMARRPVQFFGAKPDEFSEDHYAILGNRHFPGNPKVTTRYPAVTRPGLESHPPAGRFLILPLARPDYSPVSPNLRPNRGLTGALAV